MLAATRADLPALVLDGETASSIARLIGVSINTVLTWARSDGIKLPSRSTAIRRALSSPMARARIGEASRLRWADPDTRKRIVEASTAALARPEARARMSAARRGAKGVQVPSWVPLDLHGEYLDLAAVAGEEAAASQVRSLKRAMAGA